jgi:hypothetical protein
MRFARISFAALLTVALAALVVSSALALDINQDKQPPAGEVNTPYEYEFEGEEGCIQSYFTRHIAGTVPPGLEVTRDLKLVGTPTAAGDYVFWVELADEGCPGVSVPSQGRFAMTVLPDLYVATESVPTGAPGVPYAVQLEYAGFEGGYDEPRWLIKEGALPPGLTMDAKGLISGTPEVAGAWQVVIRVEEPFRRSGEKSFAFIVVQALTVVAPEPRPAEVGRPYALRLAHTGGVAPVTWSVGEAPLPPGLTLDPATGAVSGTPTRAGTFPVTFSATDAAGTSVAASVEIEVARKLRIVTRGGVSVPRGERVEIELRTIGGVAPLKWKAIAGRLPVGIRLNRRTGTLVGRTVKRGAYPVTVRARDRVRGEATTRIVLRLR